MAGWFQLRICQEGCSHWKAWLGLEAPLPRCFIPMAGKLAGGSVPLHVGLSTGMIAHPYHMVAGFLWTRGLSQQRRNHYVLVTQPWKLPNVISTISIGHTGQLHSVWMGTNRCMDTRRQACLKAILETATIAAALLDEPPPALPFPEHLLCAWYHTKEFTCMILFNLDSKPKIQALMLSSFYKYGNDVSARLVTCPRAQS